MTNHQIFTMERAVNSNPARKVIIKSVALPSEHGGWGFLIEPILLGLLVATSSPGVLLAIAASGVFLIHQPLKIAIKDHLKRRRPPRTIMAERFAVGYGLLAAIPVGILLLTMPSTFLIPIGLALPFAAVQLFYDAQNRSRRLIPELCGALALAMIAPAIAILAGWSVQGALLLWIPLALRAVTAILYVRARLRVEQGKSAPVGGVWLAHGLRIDNDRHGCINQAFLLACYCAVCHFADSCAGGIIKLSQTTPGKNHWFSGTGVWPDNRAIARLCLYTLEYCFRCVSSYLMIGFRQKIVVEQVLLSGGWRRPCSSAVMIFMLLQQVAKPRLTKPVRVSPQRTFIARYKERFRAYFSLYNPQTIPALKRLYEDFQPDVINAHNIHRDLSYQSLRLANQMNIPAVFSAHDVMPFAYHKLSHFIDASHCGVQSPDDYRLPAGFNLRQMRFRYNPLRNIIIRRILQTIDARTAPSQELCNALAANDLQGFQAVHNGIDVDTFTAAPETITALRERLNLQGRKIYFICGAAHKSKRHPAATSGAEACCSACAGGLFAGAILCQYRRTGYSTGIC